MRTRRGYLVVLARCLLLLSVIGLVFSIGGYVTSQVRQASSVATFDPASVNGYRAYGEVPIPGTQTVHLPAGKVAITFHAETVGVPETGLPIPDLKIDITPPDGVADPKVAESPGGTTSFNNDAWRQVWIADIEQAGDYQITTDGQVTAFVRAQLAFGHPNFTPPSPSRPSRNWLWASQIGFVVSLLALLAGVFGIRALGGSADGGAPAYDVLPQGPPAPTATAAPPQPPTSGVAGRLHELEALRDSGAISDVEYAAKREQIIADI
jgi:hypothetical protein